MEQKLKHQQIRRIVELDGLRRQFNPGTIEYRRIGSAIHYERHKYDPKTPKKEKAMVTRDNYNLTNNVVLDIDILDDRVGGIIASIGAYGIDKEGENHEFFKKISIVQSIEEGFSSRRDLSISYQERVTLSRSVYGYSDPVSIGTALNALTSWLNAWFGKDVVVWANRPSLVFSMIKSYYFKFDMNIPWALRNERDLDTLKDVCPEAKKFRFPDAAFISFDFAKSQFSQLKKIINLIAA